jgi:lipoyl(octanoyl) transferase
MNRLDVVDLGRRAYADVLELQRRICRLRISGVVPDDVLLLVEHDPVYTLGRATRASSLPVPPEHLVASGATVHEVERGGDVTYHGPGQLVGYPIVDLTRHRQDLHWYLRELEGAIIDALAELGVPAERIAGLTGVWTRGRKVASIGVHVKQWVTLHGFALNVDLDLSPFERIVPCGIQDVVMTSVAREAGRVEADLMRRAREAVVAAFAARFTLRPEAMDPESLAGAGTPAPAE